MKEAPSHGFPAEIWFSRPGYLPHYAEHIVDPRDGREKLVMADPHMRFGAYIYDLEKERIEWEFSFGRPGEGQVPNPHTARLLMENIEGFGKAGDIYCCSPDQRIVVIDRESREIIFNQPPPFSPGWMHEAILGVTGRHLIITDYQGGADGNHAICKVSIPGMALVWAKGNDVIPYASKVSIIQGTGGTAFVNPAYGGDYIVCEDTFDGKVWEIRDDNGDWTISFPRAGGIGVHLARPHSAFRFGMAEYFGWSTIVGTEGGGGIVSLHFTGAPSWIIGNRITQSHNHDCYVQQTSEFGTAQIYHVFPTLDGRIGFIDAGGCGAGIVGVLTGLPGRQQVGWMFMHNFLTSDNWNFQEYIPVEGWDDNWIVLRNVGQKSLKYRILGCLTSIADYAHYPEYWQFEKGGEEGEELASGAEVVWKLTQPYSYIRVDLKSAVAENATLCDGFLIQRKG